MKNTKYIIAVLSAVAISACFSGCSDTKDDSSERDSNIIYYNDTNSYVDPQQDAIDEANARESAVTVPCRMPVGIILKYFPNISDIFSGVSPAHIS